MWNEYVDLIEDNHKDRLSYPLREYFYVIGNLLIFDVKKELDHDVKGFLTFIFDAIFDD